VQHRPERTVETVPPPGTKTVASNRQARRDFEILDTVECGIALRGSEVKSLREGKVQIAESHARIIDGEAWVIGLHIAQYSHAGVADGHALVRDRKLLLHRKEIDRWRARLQTEHLALVPLSIYFKEGRAKLELGLGRGKRQHDKRQDLAKRDAERETARSMAAARRR
jgi:SsrA-binding protein